MDIKNTVVNTNENDIHLGAAYYGEDSVGSNMRKLAYRPVAHQLIEKYIHAPFKANPLSRDFTYLEFLLVNELDSACRWYRPHAPNNTKWKIRGIAAHLNVNPILLYNDPDLPEYLKIQSP